MTKPPFTELCTICYFLHEDGAPPNRTLHWSVCRGVTAAQKFLQDPAVDVHTMTVDVVHDDEPTRAWTSPGALGALYDNSSLEADLLRRQQARRRGRQ